MSKLGMGKTKAAREIMKMLDGKLMPSWDEKDVKRAMEYLDADPVRTNGKRWKILNEETGEVTHVTMEEWQAHVENRDEPTKGICYTEFEDGSVLSTIFLMVSSRANFETMFFEKDDGGQTVAETDTLEEARSAHMKKLGSLLRSGKRRLLNTEFLKDLRDL